MATKLITTAILTALISLTLGIYIGHSVMPPREEWLYGSNLGPLPVRVKGNTTEVLKPDKGWIPIADVNKY